MTGPARPGGSGGGPARVTPPAGPVIQPGAQAPRPVPGTPEATSPPASAGPVSPPDGPAAVRGPATAPAAATSGVRREKATKDRIVLNDLLSHLSKVGGSDLHLSVGTTPMVRVNGEMTAMPGQPVLTKELVEECLTDALTPAQIARFHEQHELDFAYTLEGVARFRGNLMQQRSALGAVFRIIPWEVKPLEALGIPPVINNFAAYPRGLVLVTGPTGSGKSTTLAALVDKVNRTRSGHIITIEDPIEFIHNHRGCVVNQREVGVDTSSFAEALKHVLRQDPDVILIGELRDLETISIALTAAETGHLVFATVHTQSAQDTVNRIIDVFPSDSQQQIRAQLASTLKGVVCQSLVRTADGRGRVAAAEIMVVNAAIATMIRRGETHQIPQALQSGGQQGMQTLNQHLAKLVNKGKITREAAEEYATDYKDLDALIKGGEAAVMHAPQERDPAAPATSLGGGLKDFGL
jgi:twitching motility protein PilT